MDLSIIVSTCSRAADVERLLNSLSSQTSTRCWELVLVDNNSNDNTAEIVRNFASGSPFRIRYIFEGRRGKSFGLNAGILTSSGRILAFTDDDAVLPPDWVDRIVDYFKSFPESVFIGGSVKLFDPADAPITIKLSPHAARVTVNDFRPWGVPILGCNMAIRAAALRAIGEFDTNLGPGTRIGVSEDLDIQYRFLRKGYSLDYVPEIWVFHNHGRRNPEQIEQVTRGYLTGRGAFYCKHMLCGDSRVYRWAFGELQGLFKSLRPTRWRPPARAMRLLLLGAIQYLRFRS